MILVSPTDRYLLSELGDKAMSHSLPERYGADILVVVQGRGRLGVQRKLFPDDLLASVADGRLVRELSLLAHIEYPVLMLEGSPVWTADGHLMQSWNSRWTKTQIRNLLRSVWQIHGIAVEWTDDISDTAAAVLELESWFRKETHLSLLARPKRTTRNSWGTNSQQDFARFFLQGLPGVGSVLAEAILKHFGRIPLQWTCSQGELKEVDGIGDRRANTLWATLKQNTCE